MILKRVLVSTVFGLVAGSALAGGATVEEAESRKLDSTLERLDLKGDLRLRLEQTQGRDEHADRFRPRLRFRLGGAFSLSDTLTVHARVVTGDQHDPNSANQTLGNGFDKLEISLDQAYLEWHPGSQSWLLGGKFGHPFHVASPFADLLWDQDVQPEGVMFGWSGKGASTVSLTAGQYILIEDKDRDEAWVSAAELLVQNRQPERTLGVSAAFYLYSKIAPPGATRLLDRNSGNAVVDRDADGVADDFASDFEILDLKTWAQLGKGRWPLGVSAELYHNFGATADVDNSIVVAATVGRKLKPGDWMAYYQYQHVERDAVFSALAQDDILFSSGFLAHIIGVRGLLGSGLELHLWGIESQREHTVDWVSRVRADLMASF